MPDWTALRKALHPENAAVVLPPSIRLPMLPRALMEFAEKAKDPDAEAKDLALIIMTDAGLSSELLRHVNSCAIGARQQITSVQQALVMLGVKTTQMYLTTSGMKQAMRSSASKMINFQTFWNTNLERALLAREVAKLLKADADLAFTAGMLQDFLLPLITNELYEIYVDFAEKRDQMPSLAEFERQKLGWDHARAAGQVMAAWKLPDELVCCVSMHHRGTDLLDDELLGKTAVAAVAVSALLPDAIRQENDGLEKLIELDNKWDSFELLTLAEKIDEEFESMASDVMNHFSFLGVCQKAIERANG